MSDFTGDPGQGNGLMFEMVPGGDSGSSADYRVRELEARLDRRLVALEAREGRARRAGWLAGVGIMVSFAALAAVVTSGVGDDGVWAVESVSAQEIVLRDVDGVARGILATDADGRTQLALSDRDGRERIGLTVLPDGSPGVTISDHDGRPRAVLGYLPDGTTNLVFADGQGVSRAVFGLDPDGSTQALFADPDGMIRTLVGVGADGEPSVSVFDGDEAEGEGS